MLDSTAQKGEVNNANKQWGCNNPKYCAIGNFVFAGDTEYYSVELNIKRI